MVNKDEQEFINKVIESGDFFIDDKGNRLETNDIKAHRGNIWIASPQSQIIKTKNGFIDEERAEVIQFSKSRTIEPQTRKTDEEIEKEKGARLRIFLESQKLFCL